MAATFWDSEAIERITFSDGKSSVYPYDGILSGLTLAGYCNIIMADRDNLVETCVQ